VVTLEDDVITVTDIQDGAELAVRERLKELIRKADDHLAAETEQRKGAKRDPGETPARRIGRVQRGSRKR
jgi:hypothetical protein